MYRGRSASVWSVMSRVLLVERFLRFLLRLARGGR